MRVGPHPAHWIVVTDPDTRAELGRIYRSAFAEQWSGGVPSTGLTGSQRRSIDSAAYLAQVLGEVPVLVLACLETGTPLPPGNQSGLWGTLLPAVWSYMLAARTRGLGTTWTAAHLRHEKEVADLLGIPEGVHQGALIPTAYHLGTDFQPAPRPRWARHCTTGGGEFQLDVHCGHQDAGRVLVDGVSGWTAGTGRCACPGRGVRCTGPATTARWSAGPRGAASKRPRESGKRGGGWCRRGP
ncbi:nitroreductase family protein [Actinokineospora soli]|uniref:Nitroreductase family protein n=1 Tax=Actinokineospora soli TaxID=1048753 RepID=A0ABW2TM54_9PSEU